jgi:Raf kinase inhibitor-like YbhB/YbcL family protein
MRFLVIALLISFSMVLVSQATKMTLMSKGFKNGEAIPKTYSCEGDDLSPELEWTGAPKGTGSFALICDDPDAPSGTWVHWVVWNIPKDFDSLQRGILKASKFGSGIMQGRNSWPQTGYDGPCPPPGKPHRYFFKLYALDSILSLKESATKEELLSAMKGHILAEAELMGTYRR